MKKKIKRVWSTQVADRKFSEFIRNRDGMCMRCHKESGLQCSHFWGRGFSATRYDPENCITLCYPCHYGNSKGWEYEKQGEYREFMINWLGKDKYNDLEEWHREIIPLRKAKQECMEWLKPLRKNENNK